MLVGDATSPPVRLHQLLTAWQFTDVFAAIALVLQLVAVACYILGVRRLAARGRSWSPWRTASFLAGVATLTIAIVSGLASYDDQVFVTHVVQHLLLMMVAPPLLALGAPITLAVQASGRVAQSRIVRVLHTPLLRFLTLPLVAAAFYYLSMYAYFITSLYPYSLRHRAVHDLSHVVMFGFGCLFWWPMVATDQLPHRPSFPARIISMFVGMPIEVFLGLSIMNDTRPIAPEHSLADTHAGGAVFWGAAMLITFGAALVILAQWMRQEERQAAREDRRTDAREARRLQTWEAARAAKLMISSPPPNRGAPGESAGAPGRGRAPT